MPKSKARKGETVRVAAAGRRAPQAQEPGFLPAVGAEAALLAERARSAAGRAIEPLGREFGRDVRAGGALVQGARDVLNLDKMRP